MCCPSFPGAAQDLSPQILHEAFAQEISSIALRAETTQLFPMPHCSDSITNVPHSLPTQGESSPSSSPKSLGSICALLDEIKTGCEIARGGKVPGHSQNFTSATQAVLAELLLPPHGHQKQNGPMELGALVGPGLSQHLAARAPCPWGPVVPGQDETQGSFSNYHTNPQGLQDRVGLAAWPGRAAMTIPSPWSEQGWAKKCQSIPHSWGGSMGRGEGTSWCLTGGFCQP